MSMEGEPDSVVQEHQPNKKRAFRFTAAAIIFVVGFGLFLVILAKMNNLGLLESDATVYADGITDTSSSSAVSRTEDIARAVGRLKYNTISVPVRDAGITIDTNEHHALVSYVDETNGPDTVTLAAQRSRALAGALDSRDYKTVTVVATDADGNVKAAVTNETGADESAVATSNLLKQAQSYAVSPDLYDAIPAPNYARVSDDAVTNTNVDQIAMGEKLEVTSNAMTAAIDSRGRVSTVAAANSPQVVNAAPVEVVSAKDATNLSESDRSIATSSVKAVASVADKTE
jgi:hypothetical protein